MMTGEDDMEGLKKFCPHCGGEIQEGENFCSYCGSKIDPKNIVMAKVQNDNKANEQSSTSSYYEAGYQVQDKPKKKKKTGCFVVLLVLIAVAAFGIISFNNYYKRITAINAASDFYNAVLEDAPKLESFGNDIQTEWNEAIWGNTYDSIDDGIKAATEKNYEEMKNVIGNYSYITSLYQEATSQLGPLDDKQALNDAVKDVYKGYVDLYNIVINFNCTYQEFCEDFSEADQKAAYSMSTLYALLQQ